MFPDLNNSEYIIEHLSNLGYASQGFSGYVPLNYTEIYSYMKSTNTELSPSEVKLLIRLSKAYVGQTNDKNPMTNMPYVDKDKLFNNDMSSSIKASFDKF